MVDSILNFKDFRTVAEASIIFIYDTDKLERLNTLNQSLTQVENCKEISKWIMKVISSMMKQKLEISKLTKYFQNNCGLDEAKASILKELVNIFKMHLCLRK